MLIPEMSVAEWAWIVAATVYLLIGLRLGIVAAITAMTVTSSSWAFLWFLGCLFAWPIVVWRVIKDTRRK